MDAPFLEMTGILKIYDNGIIANRYVDFSLRKGEIHSLIGENGAGKSTLMKVLYGISRAQEGLICINGEPVPISSPRDAIHHGIGMVHQHFMLIDSFTVAENIVMGGEPNTRGFIRKESFTREARAVIQRFKFDIDPAQRVRDLTVADKQKVEILKALYRDVHVLVLDEPTAILTPQETEYLFLQLHILKESGKTIVFISHKLEEVKAISDRITIMRAGKVVGTFSVEDLTVEEISHLMVKRDDVLNIVKSEFTPGQTMIEVKNLGITDEYGKPLVSDLSFEVRKREIFGIAGVAGNGQNELIKAIVGRECNYTGSIVAAGKDIKGKSIRGIRELGLCYIPEDRIRTGTAGELSIRDNLVANRLYRTDMVAFGTMREKRAEAIADALIRDYRIVCDSPQRQVSMLSGGNMQKVVVARELSFQNSIVVAEQPTRGIDIAAAEFVRSRLLRLRDSGAAILLVSADLNEILELCDTVIVLYNGSEMACFENSGHMDERMLGEYMLGLKRMNRERGVV